ncbi:MAG: hypothetical protein ACR2JW_11405 [Thermomicrobiales bacterium]
MAQKNSDLTVDYAFIAQSADVSMHGLLNVENGGITRLVVGSFTKQLSLIFVARVRAENADSPVMYTCRVTAESPTREGGNSYGTVHAYVAVREGGFFVLPVAIQASYPGEYRVKLSAYRGLAMSNEGGDFNSSDWPVIADLPLFIQ